VAEVPEQRPVVGPDVQDPRARRDEPLRLPEPPALEEPVYLRHRTSPTPFGGVFYSQEETNFARTVLCSSSCARAAERPALNATRLTARSRDARVRALNEHPVEQVVDQTLQSRIRRDQRVDRDFGIARHPQPRIVATRAQPAIEPDASRVERDRTRGGDV